MIEIAAGQIELEAPAEAAGTRLDRFLAAQVAGWSRSQLQAAIRAGRVRVNQQAQTRGGTLLRAGDAIGVDLPGPRPSPLAPADLPLTILYEDNDLVVVDKAAGMVVHPGAGPPAPTLVNALLHRYGALSAGSAPARPGIVHRLDRGTSGVMVVARNDWAHERLAAQFRARTVEKVYLALAHGLMRGAEGRVDLAIARDPRQRRRMTTRARGGREAHSRWRLLEGVEAPAATPAPLRSACRYSWLEVAIATGRTHQIRVHLAAIGHPVVGDGLYGAPAALAGPGALAGWKPERIYLHAARLGLEHPRGGRMTFTSPTPPEFAQLMERLRSGL